MSRKARTQRSRKYARDNVALGGPVSSIEYYEKTIEVGRRMLSEDPAERDTAIAEMTNIAVGYTAGNSNSSLRYNTLNPHSERAYVLARFVEGLSQTLGTPTVISDSDLNCLMNSYGKYAKVDARRLYGHRPTSLAALSALCYVAMGQEGETVFDYQCETMPPKSAPDITVNGMSHTYV